MIVKWIVSIFIRYVIIKTVKIEKLLLKIFKNIS